MGWTSYPENMKMMMFRCLDNRDSKCKIHAPCNSSNNHVSNDIGCRQCVVIKARSERSSIQVGLSVAPSCSIRRRQLVGAKSLHALIQSIEEIHTDPEVIRQGLSKRHKSLWELLQSFISLLLAMRSVILVKERPHSNSQSDVRLLQKWEPREAQSVTVQVRESQGSLVLPLTYL